MRIQPSSCTAQVLAYCDSPSSRSPIPVRFRNTNAVPPGTVASRVRFLQSLAFPSAQPAAVDPKRPAASHFRENSRTSFGRRISNRFGKPASRNANPIEEPQVRDYHSFLGLHTERSNHEEEHALADETIRIPPRTALQRIAQLEALEDRKQLGTVTPRSPLSTIESVTPRRYSGQESDILKEIDASGNQSHFMAQTSIFPGPSTPLDAGSYRREVKSRMEDSFQSETSFQTTSTHRRQSVRDLFQHYGIDRPSGLASDHEISHERLDLPKPARPPHRLCHVCSWVNPGPEKSCWRCAHRLCKECDARSPLPTARKEGRCETPIANNRKRPKTTSHEKENDPTDIAKPIRPDPTPLQRTEAVLRARERSSPPIEFPLFQMESPPRRMSRTTPPQMGNSGKSSFSPLKSRATTTKVKESPFLIADRLSRGRSSRHISAGVRSKAPNVVDHSHHQARSPIPLPKAPENCDDQTCLTTHNGYEPPYRHSSSCSQRDRRKMLHTDTGYVADTSYFDDTDDNSHSYTYPSYVRSQSSQSKVGNQAACKSKPSPLSSCSPLELIECHGYPRTGHHRHGSPTSAGVVGECQHCLDDCQCAACQGTHHSVRCCINEDHRPFLHHHQASNSISIAETPLDSGSSPLNRVPRYQAPRYSSARTMSTVVPYVESETKDQITVISSPEPKSAPLSRSSINKNYKSLPRSKQSTFIKEEMDSSTRAPWGKDVTHSPKTYPLSSLSQSSDPKGSGNTSRIPKPPPLPPPPTTRRDIKISEVDEPKLKSPKSSSNLSRTTSFTRVSGTKVSSRRDSFATKEPTAIIGAPSRKSLISPTGPRRASRQLASLFQLRDTSAVPALDAKLREHQDELKRLRQSCDNAIKAISSIDVEKRQKTEKSTRVPSTAPSLGKVMEIRKWWSSRSLRLVDKRPAAPCANDVSKSVEEHRLSDDETVAATAESETEHRLSDDETLAQQEDPDGMQVSLHFDQGTTIDTGDEQINEDEHDCFWKKRYLAKQDEQARSPDELQVPQRATVIIHFKGKPDWVFKADLSRVEDSSQK